MPMQYTPPEVAFEVTDQAGKTWIIYHTYAGSMVDNRRNFWYTPDIDESEEYEFDIRDMMFGSCNIHNEMTPRQRVGTNSHHLALQMALSRGLISFDGCGALKHHKLAQ